MGKPRDDVPREWRCWELRARGWTQVEIAAELGVCPSTVSGILSRVQAAYATSLRADVAAAQDEEIRRLEHAASEAMAAWEASKRPRRRRIAVTRGGPAPGADTQAATPRTRRVVEQVGNPAYLREAREALAGMRKILGLDAAGRAPAAPVDMMAYIRVVPDDDLDQS